MATLTIDAFPITKDVSITGAHKEGYEEILTPQAQTFLKELHIRFNDRRKALLEERQKRQTALDNGQMPKFLPATKNIREGNWRVAPLPPDLLDRRVEITGPVDRKMVINALNSGAKVFMADFEDSNTPSWHNNLQGQLNMRDAINRTIEFVHPKSGKYYKLKKDTATLLILSLIHI